MIAGLRYVAGSLAGGEHDALLGTLDALEWQDAGCRDRGGCR